MMICRRSSSGRAQGVMTLEVARSSRAGGAALGILVPMGQREMICKLHGPTPTTLACRHIVGGIACGFHTGIGEGERPDAWCDKCDEMLMKGGEWTREMNRQADLAMTCTYCYDLAAARNRKIPEHARGKRAVMTGPEFRELCTHATAQIADVQEAARKTWAFETYARWDFDEEARTLLFTDPQRPTLVADVRLVGAFTPQTKTFQWAWASHEQDNLLIAGIPGLRTYGDVRGLAELTSNDWTCKLTAGWEMTAIAGYLLGCAGVYRADFDDKYWFMLLASWRHSRRGRTVPGAGFATE